MALTDNLLAFYKLSDLTDSSGNNRTLTNNGNVTFENGKANFNGSNSLTLDPITNGLSAFTVSYKVNANGGTHILTLSDGNQESWGNYFNGNTVVSFAVQGGGDMNLGANVINNDVFVAFVVDTISGTQKQYANGILVSETNAPSSLVSLLDGKINIGSWANGMYGFVGSIDAVGIWNRALSDAEVAALYNSGAGLELEGVAQPTLVKMEAPIKFFGKVKFGV